jgi:hypothetical protein
MKNDGNGYSWKMTYDQVHRWQEARFCAQVLAMGKARIVTGTCGGVKYKYTKLNVGADAPGA